MTGRKRQRAIFVIVGTLILLGLFLISASVDISAVRRNLDPWSAIITALATAAIGYFTWSLREVSDEQLIHAKELGRAYISGGGGRSENDPNQFIMTVQNYGRTPGVISEYALVVCDRAQLPLRPAYLANTFKRTTWVAHISPGGTTLPVTAETVPQVRNPVAYGRFWYSDVWGDEHVFSFVLPISSGNDHAAVEDVDPTYTEWT